MRFRGLDLKPQILMLLAEARRRSFLRPCLAYSSSLTKQVPKPCASDPDIPNMSPGGIGCSHVVWIHRIPAFAEEAPGDRTGRSPRFRDALVFIAVPCVCSPTKPKQKNHGATKPHIH